MSSNFKNRDVLGFTNWKLWASVFLMVMEALFWSLILQKLEWTRMLYQVKVRVNLRQIGPLVYHVLTLRFTNRYWQQHKLAWCGLHCAFDCTTSTFKYMFTGGRNFWKILASISPLDLQRDSFTTIQCNRYRRISYLAPVKISITSHFLKKHLFPSWQNVCTIS